jgi:hypothetical protein
MNIYVKDEEPVEPIYRLRNAIIIQACKDYRRAWKHGSNAQINSLERFFRGSWFALLTDLDPEAIIEYIRGKK